MEHLAIAFLSLSICKQEKTIDSNLVNFVGYCTSNVIFLIKLMDVFHVHSPIKDIIVPCTATDASPIDTSPINPFSVQATDFSM